MEAQYANIVQKIMELTNKHITNDEGVVCDSNLEGYASKYRYTFVDSNNMQNDVEHDKIIFINDVMDIFNEIMVMSEAPIETQDEHINCSEFICKPGCSCGNWRYEPYVQEENYMIEDSSLQSMMGELENMNINEFTNQSQITISNNSNSNMIMHDYIQ